MYVTSSNESYRPQTPSPTQYSNSQTVQSNPSSQPTLSQQITNLQQLYAASGNSQAQSALASLAAQARQIDFAIIQTLKGYAQPAPSSYVAKASLQASQPNVPANAWMNTLSSAGVTTLKALSEFGVIDQGQLQDYRGAIESLGVLTNPNSSSRDRALAIAQAIKNFATTSYTGTYNAPNTIEGVPVVASGMTADGNPGFVLADGSVVPQSNVTTSYNAASALQAVAILTSNADTRDKITALGGLGVNVAAANQMIDASSAGQIGAAINIYNTISHWGDMSDEQRLNSGLQTANTLTSSFSGASASGAGAAGATTSAGAVLGGAAGIAGIVTGIDQASDVIDAIGDMPRSEAKKAGAIGLGTSGAAIGAGVAAVGVATGAFAGASAGSVVPVVGTVIGAAVGAIAGWAIGAFGGGKGKDQMMRDSWRDNLEEMKFAQVIDGSHHVQLADGTLYNIGKDGGHKLTNVDGTTRKTFEIDWGNKIAGEAVPEAGLYAIATGLDPSNRSGHLWTAALSQGLNAAVSNATTSEQVSNNFKSMMAQAGVDPRQLAMRIEVLRTSNKITDQEYVVYLDKVNKLYNTKLLPTDREKARMAIIGQLQSIPTPSDAEKDLFRSLVDPQKQQEAIMDLQKRITEDSAPPKQK